MTLNNEQNTVLSLMLSGKNVFLTGAAGTGKSTVIQEFKDRSKLPYVVLAPTGIAAVNVHGQTIHSFFSFPPQLLTVEALDAQTIYPSKRKLLQSVKTIIIDEISMVRADVFCAMDYRLREVAKGPNRQKPFGGKQIIVIGDFFQLSPVVSDPIEIEFMNKKCGGVYAFETTLWNNTQFESCVLKTPHRQSQDKLFIEVLNHVRNGDLTTPDLQVNEGSKSAVEVLNSFGLSRQSTPVFDPVKLCTTNYDVKRINSAERARVKSETHQFTAIVDGIFPENEYPTEGILELAEGLRVMTLCNKKISKDDFQYVNGDLGTIIKILPEKQAVIVRLDKNGNEVMLEPFIWSKVVYKVNKDIISGKEEVVQEVIGSFIQIPVRLAYAITIHKAQGLTMDNVDLKLGNGCFTHGQLYTALSRCRSLEGLLLERRISEEDLVLDKKVIDFYKNLKESIFTKNSDSDKIETVSINVPKQFEAQVIELINRLKN